MLLYLLGLYTQVISSVVKRKIYEHGEKKVLPVVIIVVVVVAVFICGLLIAVTPIAPPTLHFTMNIPIFPEEESPLCIYNRQRVSSLLPRLLSPLSLFVRVHVQMYLYVQFSYVNTDLVNLVCYFSQLLFPQHDHLGIRNAFQIALVLLH